MARSLSAIVGMRFCATEAMVAELPEGEPLRLVREPDNVHDPNAVQVWARGVRIGFVRATQARALAVEMDRVNAKTLEGKLSKSAGRGYPMVECES